MSDSALRDLERKVLGGDAAALVELKREWARRRVTQGNLGHFASYYARPGEFIAKSDFVPAPGIVARFEVANLSATSKKSLAIMIELHAASMSDGDNPALVEIDLDQDEELPEEVSIRFRRKKL